MALPLAVASTCKIAAGDRLEDVGDVHSFKGWCVGDVFPIALLQLLHKWGEGECAFIRADCQEERWKTILANGVQKTEVLVLPKGPGEGLIFQASVWRTTSSLGGVHSASDGLEQPAIKVVLKDIKVEGVVGDGR